MMRTVSRRNMYDKMTICDKECSTMKEHLEAILTQWKEALSNVTTAREVGDISVKYLGKKGEFTPIRRGLKNVAPEDRPAMRQLTNDTVAQLEAALAERGEEIDRIALEE